MQMTVDGDDDDDDDDAWFGFGFYTGCSTQKKKETCNRYFNNPFSVSILHGYHVAIVYTQQLIKCVVSVFHKAQTNNAMQSVLSYHDYNAYAFLKFLEKDKMSVGSTWVT